MADESPWDWAQRVFVGQKGAPETPRDRRARLAPGPLSAAGALSDMITAGFRGAAKTTFGWPGDIERLVGDTLPEMAGSYRSGAPLEWNLQNALVALDHTKDNHTILPSSEDLDRWLPPATTFSIPQKQNPMGSIAEWAALTPGQVGKVASGAAGMVRGGLDALAKAHAVGSAGRGLGGFGQRGAVRPRGGNFDPVSLKSQLDELRQWVPEDVPAGQTSRQEHINTWIDKQLGNYVRKDLGSPTDPLLQVEKELPNLHLPEGWAPNEDFLRSVNRNTNFPYLDMHKELSGGAPVTPWGYHSDQTLGSNSPEGYAQLLLGRKYLGSKDMADKLYRSAVADGLVPGSNAERLGRGYTQRGEMDSQPYMLATEFAKGDPLGAVKHSLAGQPDLAPLIGHFKSERAKVVPTWVDAASPDTKIWNALHGANNDLGLDHIVDYLRRATEGHEDMAYMTPEAIQLHARNPQAFGGNLNNLLALHNAGLTLDPRSLGRLSVADAARKTAAWNEHLSNSGVAGDPDLARGIKRVHKEYPGNGMKWVELGEGETPKELPPGLRLQSASGYASDSVPGRSYGYQDLDDPTKARMWRVVNEAGDDVGNGWGGHDGRGQEAVIAQFHKQKISDELSAGLNAEGAAMGHCVGGYCNEVAGRGTKIYSLRDAKGQPHVTVEVRPGQFSRSQLTDDEFDAVKELARKQGVPPGQDQVKALFPEKSAPEDIVQIKGKQNAAPVEKYLPAVQDFVKSGQWGNVGDLRNAGLYRADEVAATIPYFNLMSAKQKNSLIGLLGDVEQYVDKSQMGQMAQAAEQLMSQTGVPVKNGTKLHEMIVQARQKAGTNYRGNQANFSGLYSPRELSMFGQYANGHGNDLQHLKSMIENDRATHLPHATFRQGLDIGDNFYDPLPPDWVPGKAEGGQVQAFATGGSVATPVVRSRFETALLAAKR